MPGHYYVDFGKTPLTGNVITPSPGNDEYHAPGAGGSTNFGPMKIGHSLPDFDTSPAVQSSGGLTLTVNQNASATNPRALESQAVYVVNPLWSLPNFETLRAEVVFDLPSGTAPTSPPADPLSLDYAWGVTLALKEGNENEQLNVPGGPKADRGIRAKCQFFGGGCINFHGTSYQKDPGNSDVMFDQDLVSTDSYGDYAGGKFKPPTEFRLSMWISHRQGSGSSLSGGGTLQFGALQFSGSLLDLSAYTDIQWANAIGVSIANRINLMPSISVRLKSFRVEVTSNVPWKGVATYGGPTP